MRTTLLILGSLKEPTYQPGALQKESFFVKVRSSEVKRGEEEEEIVISRSSDLLFSNSLLVL